MKRFNLLPVVLVLVLLVGVTSCTTIGGAQDEYEERPASRGNRIYVDDPYRGTVVLERDMVTGRYYEIGTIGGAGFYGNRFYDPWGYGYRNRYNGGYYGNGGYRRGGQGPVRPQQPQQPSAEDRRRNEQNRDDARRKALGGS